MKRPLPAPSILVGCAGPSPASGPVASLRPIKVGAPACLTVAQDPEGRSVRFRFSGGPPRRSP